jgi:Novel STAND NTPase 1
VRELFRNLVTAQGTRAGREVEELLSIFPEEDERRVAKEVLAELVAARLLTSYETSIEIIHESLLNAWPRLVHWRNQDEGGALLRDQLRQAAQVWQDRGRRDDLLWTGSSYRELALWRERYSGGLSTSEEAFAAAARKLAGRNRRRRRFAVGTLVVAALSVAVITSTLWEPARSQALRAEASKLLALAQVEIDDYPTAALAYATESLELSDTPEARMFALRAMQRGPVATLTPPTTAMSAPAFSPNGEWLAIGGWQSAVVFPRDGRTGLVLGDYQATTDGVAVAFGPGNDTLMADRAGDVRIWSFPEGRDLRRGQFETGRSRVIVTEGGFLTVTTDGPREVVRLWPFGAGESRLVGSMENTGSISLDAQGYLAYSIGGKTYLRSLDQWNRPSPAPSRPGGRRPLRGADAGRQAPRGERLFGRNPSPRNA